jgi:putative hydrolase of the HAD superfamily
VRAADAASAVAAMARTFNSYFWRWPIAENVAAFRQLAQDGIPLGIVSNAHGQVEEALCRSGICQVGEGPLTSVRCVIDSGVVGIAKPDPRIFDFALDHFEGVARDRVGYVGDTVTMDVAGARAAGLYPILVDPYDDFPGVDCDRIRSLRELLSP